MYIYINIQSVPHSKHSPTRFKYPSDNTVQVNNSRLFRDELKTIDIYIKHSVRTAQ